MIGDFYLIVSCHPQKDSVRQPLIAPTDEEVEAGKQSPTRGGEDLRFSQTLSGSRSGISESQFVQTLPGGPTPQDLGGHRQESLHPLKPSSLPPTLPHADN